MRSRYRHEIDWTSNPGLARLMNKDKLVRYQINPTKNWGPGSRPKNVAATGEAAAPATTSVDDVPMGDLTGTVVGGEQEIQDLGLAVDPVEFPPGAEVAEPGAVAAEAVSTTTKRSRADGGEDRDGKKIKLDEHDEESALNM
jgi:hypothetical protein